MLVGKSVQINSSADSPPDSTVHLKSRVGAEKYTLNKLLVY